MPRSPSRPASVSLAAVFALASALPPAARAQALPELKRLSLEELMNVPISAAAGRRERPSDVPASAYVVTAETIRARGYATLLDLIEDLPQFEVQHKGTETRRNIVSVRGLAGNERLVVLYDGVRVTPLSGDIYALGTQFSLRDAERVEIVVGPVSALYGPDAFSGVVNVVTRKGGEVGGATLTGGYGLYDTQDASLSAGRALDTLPFTKSVPFLSGAELSVTAHRFYSGEPFLPGRYPGDYAWFNNQYQSGLVRTSPSFPGTTAVPVRPYDARTGSLFLHTRLDLGGFETGYLRLSESHASASGVKPDFSVYAREASFATSYSTLYGRHAYASDDGRWGLGSTLSYNTYEIDPQSRFINTFSGYQSAYKYAFDRTFQLQEQATVQLTDASPLLFGVSHEDHSALAYSADLPRPYNKDASAASQGLDYPGSDVTDLNGKPLGIPIDYHFLQYQNTGAYAQLEVRELDWLQASLGARYDHNTRYGDSANPRVGLVLKPAPRLSVKLNYGEGFLAPAPYRTHSHFGSFVAATNGLGQVTGLKSFFFHLPNPGLRPEKLREWEGEASYRFSDRLWATLDAYETQVTDLIQDDVNVGPGTFKGWPVTAVETSLNRGFARTYGGTARLDAVADLGAWTLKPDAAYSYSEGRVAGSVAPYTAAHTLQAGVEAAFRKLSLYPRLIARARSYNAQRDAAGNLQSNAPFALLDLYARWSDIVARPVRLSAYLSVTNLTDRRYYNAAFTVGSVGFAAAPQDPVRVTGGLILEF